MSEDDVIGVSDTPESGDAATEALTAKATGPIPMLYRAPTPLHAERHRDWVLKRRVGYRVAAGANSVPLNAAEAPQAARHYPIVFSAADPAVSIVVLGLMDKQNLFVNEDGQWAEGLYVPSYVRRYPFVMTVVTQAGHDDRYVLCVDEGAEHFGAAGEEGEALFDGDEPSALTKRALQFCSLFEQQAQTTRKIGQALTDSGLLQDNDATVTLRSGQKVALRGFRVIDLKAFEALSDDALLALRHAGALPVIYAHLMSVLNWSALAGRLEARRAVDAAA